MHVLLCRPVLVLVNLRSVFLFVALYFVSSTLFCSVISLTFSAFRSLNDCQMNLLAYQTTAYNSNTLFTYYLHFSFLPLWFLKPLVCKFRAFLFFQSFIWHLQFFSIINWIFNSWIRNSFFIFSWPLTFKRRIKSHLPFAGIITSPLYSARFQDKG